MGLTAFQRSPVHYRRWITAFVAFSLILINPIVYGADSGIRFRKKSPSTATQQQTSLETTAAPSPSSAFPREPDVQREATDPTQNKTNSEKFNVDSMLRKRQPQSLAAKIEHVEEKYARELNRVDELLRDRESEQMFQLVERLIHKVPLLRPTLYEFLSSVALKSNNYLFAHVMASKAIEESFFMATHFDKAVTKMLMRLPLISFIAEGTKLPLPVSYVKKTVKALATMAESIIRSVQQTNIQGFVPLKKWLEGLKRLQKFVPISFFSVHQQLDCPSEVLLWAPYKQVMCHPQLKQDDTPEIRKLSLYHMYEETMGLQVYPQEIASSLAPIAMEMYDMLNQFHPGAYPEAGYALQKLGLLLEESNEHTTAAKKFQKALSVDPRLITSRLHLANHFYSILDGDGSVQNWLGVVRATNFSELESDEEVEMYKEAARVNLAQVLLAHDAAGYNEVYTNLLNELADSGDSVYNLKIQSSRMMAHAHTILWQNVESFFDEWEELLMRRLHWVEQSMWYMTAQSLGLSSEVSESMLPPTVRNTGISLVNTEDWRSTNASAEARFDRVRSYSSVLTDIGSLSFPALQLGLFPYSNVEANRASRLCSSPTVLYIRELPCPVHQRYPLDNFYRGPSLVIGFASYDLRDHATGDALCAMIAGYNRHRLAVGQIGNRRTFVRSDTQASTNRKMYVKMYHFGPLNLQYFPEHSGPGANALTYTRSMLERLERSHETSSDNGAMKSSLVEGSSPSLSTWKERLTGDDMRNITPELRKSGVCDYVWARLYGLPYSEGDSSTIGASEVYACGVDEYYSAYGWGSAQFPVPNTEQLHGQKNYPDASKPLATTVDNTRDWDFRVAVDTLGKHMRSPMENGQPRLDIAFDTMGHAHDSQLGLWVNSRMAPIVVSWVGFAGPNGHTGHSDYTLVDSTVGAAEILVEILPALGWRSVAAQYKGNTALIYGSHVEGTVHVPYTFLPNTPGYLSRRGAEVLGPRRAIAGSMHRKLGERIVTAQEWDRLIQEHRAARKGQWSPIFRNIMDASRDNIVLACVNRHHKIDAALIDTWMNILRANPSAVLWLKLSGHEIIHQRFQEEALKRGVYVALLDSSTHYTVDTRRTRVFVLPHFNSIEYAAVLQRVDLFLDASWWGAHSTSHNMFYWGTPLLTMMSNSLPGRVGASALRNLVEHPYNELLQHEEKLHESRSTLLKSLITYDLREYEEVANSLLSSTYHLALLKGMMRGIVGLEPNLCSVRADLCSNFQKLLFRNLHQDVLDHPFHESAKTTKTFFTTHATLPVLFDPLHQTEMSEQAYYGMWEVRAMQMHWFQARRNSSNGLIWDRRQSENVNYRRYLSNQQRFWKLKVLPFNGAKPLLVDSILNNQPLGKPPHIWKENMDIDSEHPYLGRSSIDGFEHLIDARDEITMAHLCNDGWYAWNIVLTFTKPNR